jgi:hypothetical protein
MGVGAAIAGSAVLGAGASLYGSSKASSSADKAAALNQQQYQQTRADLQPYFGPGTTAVGNALSLAQSGPTGGGPDYVAQAAAHIPGQMTQAQLEQTPGYQFTLNQGLKSVQSAAAARGLGVSGASMKGAAEYATGLANKTYLDQFNVQQQRFGDYLNLNTGQQGNLTNQFNRFNSIATLGANAAAGLGTQGAALANQAGGYINASGLDQAAGVKNATNALSSGVNSYLGYNALQQALNPQTGLTGYTGPSNAVNPQYDPMGVFAKTA